jgi:hypothetical protein
MPPVTTPREKVLLADDVSVTMIAHELEDSVRLVDVPRLRTMPVPVRVHVPVPIASVRMFEPVELTAPHVTLNPFALKVPFVRVSVRADAPAIEKSPASNTVPPTPSTVNTELQATPFVVIVCVPDVPPNVVTEVPLVHVIVADTVKLP